MHQIAWLSQGSTQTPVPGCLQYPMQYAVIKPDDPLEGFSETKAVLRHPFQFCEKLPSWRVFLSLNWIELDKHCLVFTAGPLFSRGLKGPLLIKTQTAESICCIKAPLWGRKCLCRWHTSKIGFSPKLNKLGKSAVFSLALASMLQAPWDCWPSNECLSGVSIPFPFNRIISESSITLKGISRVNDRHLNCWPMALLPIARLALPGGSTSYPTMERWLSTCPRFGMKIMCCAPNALAGSSNPNFILRIWILLKGLQVGGSPLSRIPTCTRSLFWGSTS